MTWLTWTLLSMSALIAYYFFSKKMFNSSEPSDPQLYGGLLQLAVGTLALIPAIASGWHFELNSTTALLLLVVAVTYTIGPGLYYLGLKHTDLSVTTTLDATGAIYSFLLGILILGESFTLTKFSGVILIIFAIAIVSGKVKALSRFNRFEIMLLIAPFFYGIGAITDNTLIKSSNPLTYLALSFFVAGTFMTTINIPRLLKNKDKSLKSKKFIRTILINAVFVAVSGFASYNAYITGGEVSRMYPIAQSESVIVPFLAIVFLGEREHFMHKLLGAVLAFSGILLLR